MALADVAAACPVCHSENTRKLLNKVAFSMAGSDGASLPLPMANSGGGCGCGSCSCH